MSDVKIQAIINTLSDQRNQAQNAVVELVGELAERDEKIKELEAQLNPGEG